MAADFYIKAGNMRPPITLALKNADGSAADLSLADGVVFRMTLKGADNSVIDDEDGAIDVDPTTGIVSYTWQAGDTDVAGKYEGEFTIIWPTDEPQTFPSKGYVQIEITKRLPLP